MMNDPYNPNGSQVTFQNNTFHPWKKMNKKELRVQKSLRKLQMTNHNNEKLVDEFD